MKRTSRTSETEGPYRFLQLERCVYAPQHSFITKTATGLQVVVGEFASQIAVPEVFLRD
jgi:hypothetical protein